MKKFFHVLFTAAAFALLFFVQPPTASASLHYLDNNPNYPLAYSHANYREYVDLTSCTFNADDPDYYTYATGYIAYYRDADGSSREYKIRQFRQAKDGSRNPQFYSDHGRWLTFPTFDADEIWRCIQQHGYLGYMETYYPYAYYMFKIVYKQAHGVEYPDKLNGHAP